MHKTHTHTHTHTHTMPMRTHAMLMRAHTFNMHACVAGIPEDPVNGSSHTLLVLPYDQALGTGLGTDSVTDLGTDHRHRP